MKSNLGFFLVHLLAILLSAAMAFGQETAKTESDKNADAVSVETARTAPRPSIHYRRGSFLSLSHISPPSSPFFRSHHDRKQDTRLSSIENVHLLQRRNHQEEMAKLRLENLQLKIELLKIKLHLGLEEKVQLEAELSAHEAKYQELSALPAEQ